MLAEFKGLSDGEVELMLKAPILVCILIAGADGDIDRKEIKEAIAVVQKQKKNNAILSLYFREITQDFEDKVKILIQGYPHESTERAPLIVEELSQLNAIWKKIDAAFARSLYEVLKSLADRIASSSGGLWGIKTVASEEAQYLNLPMIQDPAKK
jgi:hypothetical protein